LKTFTHEESGEIVRAELEEGERLLWHGHPDPKAAAFHNARIVFIGAVIAIFGLWWMLAAADYGIPDLSQSMKLRIIEAAAFLVLMVGLGLCYTPWIAYRNARRTIYALTDRRCLIIHTAGRRIVQSYRQEDVGEVEWMIGPKKTDHVAFGSPEATVRKGVTTIRRGGFYNIADGKTVEAMVREVFNKPYKGGL